MDSDNRKLFLGGISRDTTEDNLRDHFGRYGNVLQTWVVRDKITGNSRGFGFVAFDDPSIVDVVLQHTHVIDNRTVDVKRAMLREELLKTNAGKRLFVGGFPPTLSRMEFREYFEAFGNVTDAVVMHGQNSPRCRSFGFVSFESEDSVDSVLEKQVHVLGGKTVEVKRALPKDAITSSTSSRSGGGGNYQSYGGSGANASSYRNRMDAGGYVQPAGSCADYILYGSPGYGAPAYGYGGHVGYATNAAYGNLSGPRASYLSGFSGSSRSAWNPQASSGYGSAGYGPRSGHTDQSASAAAGYGVQGYVYVRYGGNEGPYGHQVGYSNAWRFDSTQGGSYGIDPANAAMGYGRGYGASQSRQGQ